MSDVMFEGRIALVTGAASGIGAATARMLAESGASALILVDADGERLDRFAASIPTQELMTVARDVRDEEAWERLESETKQRFGLLDLAVINAGVALSAKIVDTDYETWRHVLGVNLDGAFLSLRSSMRLMRGGGSIVLVSSVSGVKAEAGVSAYGASKAAVIQLARIAAKEGAEHGIRVNTILPGGVETPIWRNVPVFQQLVAEHGGEDAAFDAMAQMATPLGRYAAAEEIAAQIGFFLSPASATITGSVLISDGGYSL
jgi:NAD(P)-dependent dehydrogenase (short-subunit alcohol dehydrogenase family)